MKKSNPLSKALLLFSSSAALLVFSAFLIITPLPGKAEVPLVFISAPDPHFVDYFIKPPPTDPNWLTKVNFLMNSMAQFKPAFTLIDGDLGIQHWWDPKYHALCAPGGTLRDIILGCANKTYTPLTNLLTQKGLTPYYIAVGDHEIGDNDWPLGVRSEAVPYFKEAFAKHFTTNPDGTSKFNGIIGGVPMRPLGTPYQNTSYAVKTGNLLIVTVDLFQQKSPTKIIGRRGTVEVAMRYDDGHLTWLDNLLAMARLSPAIKFIIVQGHTPVLTPVRAVKSSNMFHEGFNSSDFWKVLRKHKVDLYFAGEVHNVTVNRDTWGIPDLVQVAHVGGRNFGFLVGRVFSNSIQLELHRIVTDINGNSTLVKDSTLVIDKSLPTPKISSTGLALKPVDPYSLQIHYTFDGDISTWVTNNGGFGVNYNAKNTNVTQIPLGKLSQAAHFDGKLTTQLVDSGITPTTGYSDRTFSVWIQTTPRLSPRYLWPSGQQFGNNQNSMFRVFINPSGKLGVQVDTTKMIMANQGVLRLDDQLWHQVGVVFPGGSQAVLNDVSFYIDGKLYPPATHLFQGIFTNTSVDDVQIGGNKTYMAPWSGNLDDFAIWTWAFKPSMMNAVFTCANGLGYDASNMETLLKLYRHRSGSALVKGRLWQYATGLSGAQGYCKPGTLGTYSLVLDSLGQGLKATVP